MNMFGWLFARTGAGDAADRSIAGPLAAAQALPAGLPGAGAPVRSIPTTEQRRAALIEAAGAHLLQPPAKAMTAACYVSYAWGDATESGRHREAEVDELCRHAEAEGIKVHRDKDGLSSGDRISLFMRRMGTGGRVFIFLSDKYLKSPYCMHELCEIWRDCREQDEDFIARTRVFVLPCARVATLSDRAHYARYWQETYERDEAIIRTHGSAAVGARGMEQHKDTKRYAMQVADLLALMNDVVRPSTFEDFLRTGFDGG